MININKRPSHFNSLKVIKNAAKRNVPGSSAVLQELGSRATLELRVKTSAKSDNPRPHLIPENDQNSHTPAVRRTLTGSASPSSGSLD